MRRNGPTEIETDYPASMFSGHEDNVSSVTSTRDGALVVSGGKDKCVIFWEADSAQMLFKLRAPQEIR